MSDHPVCRPVAASVHNLRAGTTSAIVTSMAITKRNTPKPRSGAIPAAPHRTSAGRMRRKNDRRAKDARRVRETTEGWS